MLRTVYTYVCIRMLYCLLSVRQANLSACYVSQTFQEESILAPDQLHIHQTSELVSMVVQSPSYTDVRMYVLCTYVRMYVCTYLYNIVYFPTYVRTYVCMYVQEYAPYSNVPKV